MSRDFIPKGSEQPVVFELTMNGKQVGRTGGGRTQARVEKKVEKKSGKWMHPQKRPKDFYLLIHSRKKVRKAPRTERVEEKGPKQQNMQLFGRM